MSLTRRGAALQATLAALQAAPESADAYARLGALMAAGGKRDAARQACEKALALDPACEVLPPPPRPHPPSYSCLLRTVRTFSLPTSPHPYGSRRGDRTPLPLPDAPTSPY